jgi:hypothetical protein
MALFPEDVTILRILRGGAGCESGPSVVVWQMDFERWLERQDRKTSIQVGIVLLLALFGLIVLIDRIFGGP